MAEHGRIGHVEWTTRDPERTRTFFGTLFGWTFRDFGDGYTVFKAAGYTGGGFMHAEEPVPVVPGTTPSVYVEVDSIEEVLGKVPGLGGTVETPRTEIPETGWFAHVRDPDGNRVGLYEEKAAS